MGNGLGSAMSTIHAVESNMDLMFDNLHAEASMDKQPFKVLIAVDDSKEAERAFDWYVRHLHRPENSVAVLHTCERNHPVGTHSPDYVHSTEEWFTLLKVCGINAKKIVEKYEKKLKETQVSGDVKLYMGPPGAAILEYADQISADHIVMGSRGLGPLTGAILGSVSRYVSLRTPIGVTIIPGSSHVRTKRPNPQHKHVPALTPGL